MVQELLLGDNPFIGVSHLSQEKARAEVKEVALENRANVVEAALKGGATGFTFSTHEGNLELLAYLNETREGILGKMNYYILVPYAQSYVRRANVKGTQGLIKPILKSMVLRRSYFLGVLEALTFKPEKFVELFIEAELAPYLKILPREKIKAILLHEIFTELLLAFDLVNVLRCLDREVRRKLKVNIGLETRNFGHLCQYLSEQGYCPDYLMTPINAIGYQMAPSKEVVEWAIDDFGAKTNIIAINIMASGALSLDEAVTYVAEYKNKIYAVTSASTKSQRIYGNFRKLSQSVL